MTIAFMGLLTAVITERIGVAVGRRAFAALLAIGMGSVAWWYWSELRHSGDLRPYLVVQFGSVAVIALLLWLYPPRYSGGAYLVTTLGLYGAAKALESADGQVFRVTGFVSGHTLKHLVAALAGAALIVMLQVREDATPTGPDMEAML
jgi:hypothetical protein